MALLWVLYHVVANSFYASEEWIAFLFRVTEFHWMDLEGITSPEPLRAHRKCGWRKCVSLLAQPTEKCIHFDSSISQTNSATQNMEEVRSFETWEYLTNNLHRMADLAEIGTGGVQS
jgi:hypothetical protein